MPQGDRDMGDIAGADRVPVHRRDGKRRLRASRRDILGENPADRIGDRHLFRRQRFERRQQPRQRFFDRDHAGAS